MGHKVWVRVARCQLLVSCLFTLILAVACCLMTVITSLSSHFSILIGASPTDSGIRSLHQAMVLYGSGVSAMLLLTVLVSTVSVLRESQHIMATAFIGFGFLFCILVAGLTWTQDYENQVEASLLDVYDEIYEQVLRSSSGEAKEHLLNTHTIFQCCGKTGQHLKSSETFILCNNNAEEQDCISKISEVLHVHLYWVQMVLLLSLGFMVYGMVLSSFLYFSLPRGNMWDRRGEYNLNNALISPPDNTPDTPFAQLLPYQRRQ